MRKLHSPEEAARWLKDRVTGGLDVDSRRLAPGDGFIAWPGAATDGRLFVTAALQGGAPACLVEAQGAEAWDWAEDPRVAVYAGLKQATALIAEAYYGQPGADLTLAAVTGTNGKTSTAWWIAQALTALGRPCGLVGTLGVGMSGQLDMTGLTTPDPVRLQQALAGFVEAGAQVCAMEASSIGLAEHRLDGLPIRIAAFTNLTQDHLDYHGTMQAYWEAKKRLFSWPGLVAAVVNADDAHGSALLAELAARHSDLSLVGYSRTGVAEAGLQAEHLEHGDAGLSFDVRDDSGHEHVTTRLVGDYNVSNLLAVIGVLRVLGVSLVDAARACSHLDAVPGRMQRVPVQGGKSLPRVVVDFAHTPDALEQALKALRPLAKSVGGRLWCVFGCGGDRDASKRPVMGNIAQREADEVVVTSDNPRSERPEDIVSQIMAGTTPAATLRVEVARQQAIELAVREAAPHDVVLVAGKGHEDYQDIAGTKHPFSDVRVAEQALLLRARSLLNGWESRA